MTAAALAKPEVFAKPFLKWAGGKAQLLPTLLPLIQGQLKQGSAYHEPFLGGGAVFFALRAAGFAGRACLSDVNVALVNAYIQVALFPERLIRELEIHAEVHSRDYFYAVREELNTLASLSLLARAAHFIYLNKTCFNGLYRVNAKTGTFNVPIGRFKSPPTICDAENIRACAAAIRSVESTAIQAAPFEVNLSAMRAGDVAYLDPPYVPVSKTSNFVGYGRDGFTSLDQAKLEHELTKLDRLGAKFVLSNADCEETRTLYRKWNVKSVEARRNVNSKGAKRGPVGELVVTNF
jgi:DNA adenine methylase